MSTPPSDKPKCGAQKRQGEPGDTCTLTAGFGTDHVGAGRCKFHGGNTPTQRQAAVTEQLEAQARATLARLDVTPVDNPFTALSRLAGQAVAWQEALSEHVNRLERFRYEGGTGTEQLRAEIALYERAMDRCGQILGTIAKLNIDERMAKITERQAERVIDAIDAVLEHLGLSGDQATEARQIAARHLRAVS